ncbi:MAG: hypothetical protein CFE34_14970 [Rhodobacteraceae bacterium PARR1]|nr:MAG: hypothetical protein CFE34_14970 [Rhodobacteraceae bacterium PARR1]
MRTIPFSLTGQPAITLPAGFDNGLPLSIQLAARIGDEDLLCAAAHAFEQATDHATRPPFILAENTPRGVSQRFATGPRTDG